MSTVKLGVIVNFGEGMKKLSEMPLKAVSGKKALQIRKTLKALNAEVETFNEAREQYIKENGETGEDGQVSISSPEAIQKANEFFNDMIMNEVEITWEPLFDEATIESVSEHVDLSIKDLDFLEALGLMVEEESEVREVVAEEMN